jgi:RND family efflux transporter MFP subunit
MNISKKIIAYIKQLSLTYKILGIFVILIALFTLLHFINRNAVVPAVKTSNITHVDVSTVASLSDKNSSIALTGKVSSMSKATILAISSGEIVSLSRSLGDYVEAGSIIASFENSSQRAAVLQSQGIYDGAVASQKSVSPMDSKNAVINAYKSTYNTLDSILTSQVDIFFSNPGKYGSSLLINYYPYPDNKISKERDILREDMNDYQSKLSNAESNDPDVLLKNANSITQKVSNILNELATSANTPGSLATSFQLSSLITARASINNLNSTLASVQQSYRSQSVTTTSSVEANVMTALGGLHAAQANLEKTYVRAPISGTIVSLPITKGGYVSSFSQVAQISNPNALEVDVYVTSDDAKTLAVGSKALIDESTNGVIVFIAPALDPTTGKILVKIGISNGQANLTDGNTVTVSLDRSIKTNSKTDLKMSVSIPIVSTKITPTGPIVFTVSESNKLIANNVTFGDIIGGQVTVLSGLTSDMEIVKDARGLTDGQEVIINLTK